jgi:hypothetical protein
VSAVAACPACHWHLIVSRPPGALAGPPIAVVGCDELSTSRADWYPRPRPYAIAALPAFTPAVALVRRVTDNIKGRAVHLRHGPPFSSQANLSRASACKVLLVRGPGGSIVVAEMYVGPR